MGSLVRIAAGVAVAALLAARSLPADCAEAALRFAVVTTAADAEAGFSGEFASGVALAAAGSNDQKAAGARRSPVETLALTAGDAATAAAVVDKAAKEKLAGVVAFTTETVAAELEAAARRAKVPLVLVGPGGPTRTLDPADPVLRVEPSAADRGLALAEMLRFRSGRSSIGLPAQTQHAWLVVDDSAWARAVADALHRDDVDGLVTPGAAVAKPGVEIDAAQVSKARAASCDRVVVIGGGRTVRGVCVALDRARWDPPLLCLDTALDGSAWRNPDGNRRKITFVAAVPMWAEESHVEEVVAKHPPAAGKPAQLTPAAARGFTAAAALIEAALQAGKRPTLAGMRDVTSGIGASMARLLDAAGSVERWCWSTWTTSADGSVAPVKASYLPDAASGPFLGPGLTRRYHAIEGSTCVRVGFGGGADQPPRTIEADLATIGLGAGKGKVDELAREQILARTAGKLSRIWGRAYDGSARAAYSFRIAFVPEPNDPHVAAADPKNPPAVWDAVIAGDGPDSQHGGQSFPGKAHCQAFSTYLIRNAALLQRRGKLDPPLCDADATYLDGTYAWNTSADGNARADRIRALLDGVASTFSMKLSKEIGHLAGLSIDNSGDPTSVMVTTGGEGVSDEFAVFPPAFAKVLEKTLGRVGASEGR